MALTLSRPFLRSSWLALGLPALLALAACQDKTEAPAAAPLPIIENQQLRYPSGHPQLKLLVTQAAEAAQSITVELPARLVWNEVKTQRVLPAYAGRVTRIAADVGQQVQAGQLLAQLSSAEFGAAQADSARAQAEAQLAEQNLARAQSLFEAGVVARKDYEQVQAEALRAQAERARAQARTRLHGGGSEVNQQLALRADMAGVVVERNLNPGQEVRPEGGAQPLFVVSDPSVLWVQIDAQEADLGDLRPGSTVSLFVSALRGESVPATVQAVTDQIDPTSRTIKVRAVVANPQRLLKNEMLGRVRYQRRVAQSVAVPASAVFLHGTQHRVFVEGAPGLFAPRDVRVVHEGTQQVLIGQGLQVGERVVTENGLLLERELRLAQEAAQHGGPAK